MMIYMHVTNAYTTYHSSRVIVNLKATGIHDVNHQLNALHGRLARMARKDKHVLPALLF